MKDPEKKVRELAEKNAQLQDEITRLKRECERAWREASLQRQALYHTAMALQRLNDGRHPYQ